MMVPGAGYLPIGTEHYAPIPQWPGEDFEQVSMISLVVVTMKRWKRDGCDRLNWIMFFFLWKIYVIVSIAMKNMLEIMNISIDWNPFFFAHL